MMCVVWFHHYTDQWTTPNITGDRPPPVAGFTLTKIDIDLALMYGGSTPHGLSSDIRVARIGKDSVVSECVLFVWVGCIPVISLGTNYMYTRQVLLALHFNLLYKMCETFTETFSELHVPSKPVFYKTFTGWRCHWKSSANFHVVMILYTKQLWEQQS